MFAGPALPAAKRHVYSSNNGETDPLAVCITGRAIYRQGSDLAGVLVLLVRSTTGQTLPSDSAERVNLFAQPYLPAPSATSGCPTGQPLETLCQPKAADLEADGDAAATPAGIVTVWQVTAPWMTKRIAAGMKLLVCRENLAPEEDCDASRMQQSDLIG